MVTTHRDQSNCRYLCVNSTTLCFNRTPAICSSISNKPGRILTIWCTKSSTNQPTVIVKKLWARQWDRYRRSCSEIYIRKQCIAVYFSYFRTSDLIFLTLGRYQIFYITLHYINTRGRWYRPMKHYYVHWFLQFDNIESDELLQDCTTANLQKHVSCLLASTYLSREIFTHHQLLTR